jgi:hypothetical protein
VVRNDEERDPIANVGRQKVDQTLDLALEAGRNVVDRCDEALSRH